MKIRHLFLLCCCFAAMLPFANAQMERTIYQVFPADSTPVISIDIPGTYEIVAWAGDNIMTETKIQVWNASPDIVKFLIENGRYHLVADTKEQSLAIATKIKERKPIKTPRGECTEIITVKIFVPDMYEWSKNDMKTLRIKTTTVAPATGG
jgi:hypothetical protein